MLRSAMGKQALNAKPKMRSEKKNKSVNIPINKTKFSEFITLVVQKNQFTKAGFWKTGDEAILEDDDGN